MLRVTFYVGNIQTDNFTKNEKINIGGHQERDKTFKENL